MICSALSGELKRGAQEALIMNKKEFHLNWGLSCLLGHLCFHKKEEIANNHCISLELLFIAALQLWIFLREIWILFLSNDLTDPRFVSSERTIKTWFLLKDFFSIIDTICALKGSSSAFIGVCAKWDTILETVIPFYRRISMLPRKPLAFQWKITSSLSPKLRKSLWL